MLILFKRSGILFCSKFFHQPLISRSAAANNSPAENGAAVGTTVAQSTFVMSPIDFFIIYLACGAPVGVYYFLQNRTGPDSKLLWLKTLLNFIFWLPAAFLLLKRGAHLKNRSVFDFNKTLADEVAARKNLQSIQKQIEKNLPESDSEISVYEFRETIERYVGLTLANQTSDAGSRAEGEEFFRAAQTNNIELSAICLDRRNRKRLSFHQTEARKDFLYLINQMLRRGADKKNLEQSAIRLAAVLKDLDAQSELEKTFARRRQTGKRLNVVNTKNDLWKHEAPKSSPAKRAAYRPRALKAIANLRSKD